MSEGDIEFVAWGPLSCPFGRWAKRPWAVVQAGRYRICLGQTFWEAAGKADFGGTATTLLHECLHIYFDTIRHKLERWAFNTATCYERYVLLCNGYPIPADVDEPCPSKIPGAPVAVKSSKTRRFGVGLLGAPPDRFKKGGLPVGEDDAKHLLTILAGKSSYQPYLARAMADRATTVPKRFFRDRDERSSQVPKHLRHLFTRGGGRMTGGTIDRWTRTVYVCRPPGLRVTRRDSSTRFTNACTCLRIRMRRHSSSARTPCIGTFQHEFGTGFGEGLTQVITEDIMDAQGISRYHRDRPYEDFVAVMREVVKVFGLDAMARAYFFGDVKSLRTSMEARWGTEVALGGRPDNCRRQDTGAHADSTTRGGLSQERMERPLVSGRRPIASGWKTSYGHRQGATSPLPAGRGLGVDIRAGDSTHVHPCLHSFRRSTASTSAIGLATLLMPDQPPQPSWSSGASVRSPQQVRVDAAAEATSDAGGRLRAVAIGHGTTDRRHSHRRAHRRERQRRDQQYSLGQHRVEAVQGGAARSASGRCSSRVLIEVEESPGKSKPIGDNRTAKGPGGQSTRRRVCRAADSEGPSPGRNKPTTGRSAGSGSRRYLGSVPIQARHTHTANWAASRCASS